MKALLKIMFLAIAALLIWTACNGAAERLDTERHYPSINGTKGPTK